MDRGVSSEIPLRVWFPWNQIVLVLIIVLLENKAVLLIVCDHLWLMCILNVHTWIYIWIHLNLFICSPVPDRLHGRWLHPFQWAGTWCPLIYNPSSNWRAMNCSCQSNWPQPPSRRGVEAELSGALSITFHTTILLVSICKNFLLICHIKKKTLMIIITQLKIIWRKILLWVKNR